MNLLHTNWMGLPILISIAGILISCIPTQTENWALKLLFRAGILNAFLSVLALIVFLPNMPSSLSVWTYQGLGLELQSDSLSLILMSMVSTLGMFILLFSKNYMAGDPRQLYFVRQLSITYICAIILIVSGNLFTFFIAWMSIGLILDRVLLFYKVRPRAAIPAHKKFILARVADVCLITAFFLIYSVFGTGNFVEIHRALLHYSGPLGHLEIAAALMALAVMLKSAQFPFHSWLIEVMETPTPVSALLHAGVLNAGPALVMRFSDIFSSTHSGSTILIIMGGFTAVYAAMILLTQPAIKTLLAYSSAAHMGFSIFLCGIGAYSAALLHLFGHSFYKAYAFLSSGTAIQDAKKTGPISSLGANRSIGAAIASLLLAIGIYVGMAYVLEIPFLENPYRLVGVVIILGATLLLSPTFKGKQFIKKSGIALGMAAVVYTLFFGLEHMMHYLTHLVFDIPSTSNPVMHISYIAVILLNAIGIGLQSSGFTPKRGGFSHRFYIHLRNGFYASAVFDRSVGSLKVLKKELE